MEISVILVIFARPDTWIWLTILKYPNKKTGREKSEIEKCCSGWNSIVQFIRCDCHLIRRFFWAEDKNFFQTCKQPSSHKKAFFNFSSPRVLFSLFRTMRIKTKTKHFGRIQKTKTFTEDSLSKKILFFLFTLFFSAEKIRPNSQLSQLNYFFTSGMKLISFCFNMVENVAVWNRRRSWKWLQQLSWKGMYLIEKLKCPSSRYFPLRSLKLIWIISNTTK